MIGMFAPTTRARRILIALLAFAIAIGFAIVALVAPADAAKDDKDYSATAASAPSPLKGGKSGTVTVTFENELDNTTTQKAGTFKVVFPAGFSVDGVATPVAFDTLGSPSGFIWEVWGAETSGNTVVISAFDGGHRIGVGETVSVAVTVTAPSFDPGDPNDPNKHDLTTAGDQEDHGNFRGGNKFNLQPPEPNVFVEFGGQKVTCNAGNILTCETSSETQTTSSGNQAGATSSCDGGDCAVTVLKPSGELFVESDPGVGCDGCEAVWVANSTTDGFFHLIITIAEEDLGGKVTILVEQPVDSGNYKTARNCQPPKRVTFCVDIKHPQYDKKAGVYPVRFEAGDPRSGY